MYLLSIILQRAFPFAFNSGQFLSLHLQFIQYITYSRVAIVQNTHLVICSQQYNDKQQNII